MLPQAVLALRGSYFSCSKWVCYSGFPVAPGSPATANTKNVHKIKHAWHFVASRMKLHKIKHAWQHGI